ncbi:uncharacterized protein LOC129584066 [Paramacrobiotus metropolitanus]|uniref:uncharacterized protein LOC129584066 n=1 Tax=Paramacrobiotus metropolitanus TaxID=2943436 RepID=UPI002445AF18|nr:uncharacterized protein LOC129584066 [Paramacrobiotus metropolitanus]
MAAVIVAPLLCCALILLMTLFSGCDAISCVICNSIWDPLCTTDPGHPNVTKQDCAAWCGEYGLYGTTKEISEGATGKHQKYPPVECPTTFTSCHIVYQETTSTEYTKGYPEKRVFRKCGFHSAANQTAPVYGYFSGPKYKKEVVTCFTDFCNTATVSSSSYLSVLTFLLFLYFADR